MRRIYLDTSVLLAIPLKQRSPAVLNDCEAWLRSAQRREISAVISTLTWDEFVYVFASKARGDAEGTGYRNSRAVEGSRLLLGMKFLQMAPVEQAIVEEATELLERVDLRPRDCMHALLARAYADGNLLTLDNDFRRRELLDRLGVRITLIEEA